MGAAVTIAGLEPTARPATTLASPTCIGIPLRADENAKLHAHLDRLVRPKDGSEEAAAGQTHVVTLHPPQQPLSSRSVKLQVTFASLEAGSCSLTISAQHWFINSSSLPLDVHEASATGGLVLHAHTNAPRPFSLSSDASLARVGVAVRDGEPVRLQASATGVGELPGLSKAFSVAAVGNDMALEVAHGEGAAELAIRVTAATGDMEYADRATVVTLHDRISIQNSTGIALEWRQKSVQHVTHDLLPDEETVSLHWDHAGASRLLHVRPKDLAHEWCAAFSPERLGETTLKLVRAVHMPAVKPLKMRLQALRRRGDACVREEACDATQPADCTGDS